MVARILTPAEATAIQTALNEVAHAQLMVDGHFGALSQQAVMRFQADHNISPADGNPSQPTLDALGIPNLFAPPVRPHLTPNPVVQAIGAFALNLIINRLTQGLIPMNFLSGYKTYIIAVFLIVAGTVELFGVAIPGMTGAPVDLIVMGFGLITGRVATANVAAGK